MQRGVKKKKRIGPRVDRLVAGVAGIVKAWNERRGGGQMASRRASRCGNPRGIDAEFIRMIAHPAHRGLCVCNRVHDRRSVPTLDAIRSEEHTSELPSLMRISYAVLC